MNLNPTPFSYPEDPRQTEQTPGEATPDRETIILTSPKHSKASKKATDVQIR